MRGGIQFRQDIRPPYPFVVARGVHLSRKTQLAWTHGTFLGFGESAMVYPWQKTQLGRRIIYSAPLYAFAMVTAVMPVLWIARRKPNVAA